MISNQCANDRCETSHNKYIFNQTKVSNDKESSVIYVKLDNDNNDRTLENKYLNGVEVNDSLVITTTIRNITRTTDLSRYVYPISFFAI